eukprot:6252082-Pyramimonas_sp.AAC.1
MVLIGVAILVAILFCVAGCCAGWCVGYFVRPTDARESEMKMVQDVAPKRAAKAKREKVERRTISTQSQVTYSWHKTTPRFVPLGEWSQGAWAE